MADLRQLQGTGPKRPVLSVETTMNSGHDASELVENLVLHH